MPRLQALVVRNDTVLMVMHHHGDDSWWCLPGGALEANESAEQGTLRELKEECNVDGVVLRLSSWWVSDEPDVETITYLVDIGDQEPPLGVDPETGTDPPILVDVKWLGLSEIAERDRAFLWAAGLLGTGGFFAEVEQWGDRVSYPGMTGTTFRE